jgi:hydrogenase/urease accessory protein HupE
MCGIVGKVESALWGIVLVMGILQPVGARLQQPVELGLIRWFGLEHVGFDEIIQGF